MAAGHWQSIREAADELGVAPETLTRRLRSGRPEGATVPAADASAHQQQEDAPLPPQPAAGEEADDLPPPLPKPPLCTLPPGKPLPPSGWTAPRPQPTGTAPLTAIPLRRASDAAAIAAATAASNAYLPPRDRIDDAFMAAVEEELKEIRSQRHTFVPSVAGAAAAATTQAVTAQEPTRKTPPVLEMADPLHAQVQDSRKQIRSMWVGITLLLIAVFAGALWTTVRMDRAEQMISSLIQQLDSERTLSQGYKQEITRLFQALTDNRANQSKNGTTTTASNKQQDGKSSKRPDGRLTSGE